MKTYNILFTELDKCDFIVDYEYHGSLNDYTYNGISYKHSPAFYYDYLNNLYNQFLQEWCSLSDDEKMVARGMAHLLMHKRYFNESFFYDVPSTETIVGMINDKVPTRDIKMAQFLHDMAKQQITFANQVKNFFENKNLIDGKTDKTTENTSLRYNDVKEEINSNNSSCNALIKTEEHAKNLYQTLYDKFGDTMSVAQISSYFSVTARTVRNWETKGYISNISATSSETKSNGDKKRGEEKRFLTYDIAKSIEIQRKFAKL